MKRPTFSETVDVLVKAYLNDTLEHGNCSACAVGNLIADACGYKYKKVKRRESLNTWKWRDGQLPKWYDQNKSTDLAVVIECQQTKATGYTTDELERIEHAFESADYDVDAMFNGLMAVVDVLAKIHNVDLSAKESAKLQFVKP